MAGIEKQLEEARAQELAAKQQTESARLLVDSGEVAQHQGELAAAQTHYDEALALAQELGQPNTIAEVRFGLGNLARRAGDYERAEDQLRQSLSLAGPVGEANRAHHAQVHRALGAVARCREDWQRASAEYREGLELLSQGQPYARAYVLALREVALLWAAAGRPLAAVRLFANLEADAARLSVPVPPVDSDHYQRSLAAARAALGEAAFAAAWETGRALTLEQAAAYGLEQLAPPLPALSATSNLEKPL
jgi:tetratricopeptide (TPR) repeat protein